MLDTGIDVPEVVKKRYSAEQYVENTMNLYNYLLSESIFAETDCRGYQQASYCLPLLKGHPEGPPSDLQVQTSLDETDHENEKQ